MGTQGRNSSLVRLVQRLQFEDTPLTLRPTSQHLRQARLIVLLVRGVRLLRHRPPAKVPHKRLRVTFAGGQKVSGGARTRITQKLSQKAVCVANWHAVGRATLGA